MYHNQRIKSNWHTFSTRTADASSPTYRLFPSLTINLPSCLPVYNTSKRKDTLEDMSYSPTGDPSRSPYTSSDCLKRAATSDIGSRLSFRGAHLGPEIHNLLQLSRNGHMGHSCRIGVSGGCIGCSFGCMSYSGRQIVNWFTIVGLFHLWHSYHCKHPMGLLVQFRAFYEKGD